MVERYVAFCLWCGWQRALYSAQPTQAQEWIKETEALHAHYDCKERQQWSRQ